MKYPVKLSAETVKILAESEPCRFGVVIDHSDGAYLLKVAKADEKQGRIFENPHYRLYGENLIEKI